MPSASGAVRSEGNRPATTTPARTRLIARTRRLAFAVACGLLLIGAGVGWALRAQEATSIGPWHGAALVLVLAAAAAFAARTTGVMEGLFRQEDRLLRSVVHEIRAPLSRLLLTLDMGTAAVVPADQALKDAGIEATALQELLDDLVEAARILSGTLVRPSDAVELGDVVPRVVGQVPVAPATVEVDADGSTVTGSARLVRLAVVNLVRNAAHHGYRGGSGTIRVIIRNGSISVIDDGPGIPARRLAQLQQDLPRGFRQAGSGLGLALAAWVAEVHGGQLHLANRAGGGFEARLDLGQPADAPTVPS